jgi:hypothetical protein
MPAQPKSASEKRKQKGPTLSGLQKEELIHHSSFITFLLAKLVGFGSI